MGNRHTVAGKYIDTFFKLSTPCNFPGCAELRDTYIKELRSSSVGGGCASCKRMALMSKYKRIIENRISLNK